MSDNIKIKLLSTDALLPRRATEGSVAFDLFVPRDTEIKRGRQVIPLDFAIELPEGFEAKIEPRSGFSSKGMEGFEMWRQEKQRQNSNEFEVVDTFIGQKPRRYEADVLVGKIDWDYRGNVGVIVKSADNFLIKRGTRIAQLTIYPVIIRNLEPVDVLTDTDRGDGGFGSTQIETEI
jgi:dUTP pyrophosphatase